MRDWDSAMFAELARLLKTERGLDAVRLNSEGGRVEVATLGEVDWELLQVRLREVLEGLKRDLASRASAWSGPSSVEGMKLSRDGESVLIERPGCPTAPKLRQWRELPWIDAEEKEEEDWREGARDAALCGIGLAVGFACSQWESAPGWAAVAAYALAMVAGGRDAAIDSWQGIQAGRLDIHFLMLAVAVGAAAVGAWGEGALLLFLFSASGAMEAYAAHRTKGAISALLHAAPQRALREAADGTEEEVDVGELRVGDILRIRPGDLAACDAEVISGSSAVDESALTGESVPCPKGPGDRLLSGSINTWGSLRARVLRPARQSALQKIIDLIRSAQHRKAPSQRFTDRFGKGYATTVLVLTALMFLVWWLVLGVPPFVAEEAERSAFYRAMTLLVVMSPCALVLSIPSAILAAIAAGARQGVLFRGGSAVEMLADTEVVALDKTGTLTTGELEVAEVHSIPPGREQAVLEAACALEAHSSHPIARAILKHGRKMGQGPATVEDFQNHSGQGLSGRAGDSWCVLGRRELVARGPLAKLAAAVPPPPAACSEVWVLHQNVLGRILLRDRVRTESGPVLRAMRRLGLRPVMLTGDRPEVAREVGAEIGLAPEEIEAGLLPEGKVEAVRRLAQGGRRVAMVGDGVNDAPSLAAADVSVAMGVRGSDAALEQSDVVLMNDRIDLFLHAWQLSRAARAVIRQNLVLALGTVAVMSVAALTGKVPLSLGVLAHEGSTVLVCLNSLRLLFFRPELPQQGNV